MIVLQASHVAKQFDGHEVLLDASLVIQERDRVALVGRNGAGKSTLLKIVMGFDAPDAGSVSLIKTATLGYVAQAIDVREDVTVFEFVSEAFQDITAMEYRLRDLEHRMADEAVYSDANRFQAVSDAYDRLRHEFENAGGYAVEARIRRVLDGLEFPKSMHGMLVSSLSGGQKTRLSLARLLAMEPTVLVLDEPTNYLDTETLTWLEDYLQSYAGAILIVSHDRYFLDEVATVVYELENGKTTRYMGNYSTFVEAKAVQAEADEKRFVAQQKEIARQEEFVQKNIVRASTTKRAQSRRKWLDRMERMERPSGSEVKMALRFTCGRTSGKDVLHVERLVAGYEGEAITSGLQLSIKRGMRVALVGPNGIGKSTLLKSLAGRLAPVAGHLRWGTNVDLGYYDQEQTDLPLDKTALDLIWDTYPGLDRTTVRSALARFLFRGEEVDKPVSGLSGGERSRLALCRLMLAGSNVLLLDEPTNHLDLLAKEVLEDALQDYEGMLLFVSHDRYFIDALATHILTLDETGFHWYIGNYTEYRDKRAEAERHLAAENESDSHDSGTRKSGVRATVTMQKEDALADPIRTPADPQKPVRSADLRKLREKVRQLEERIADIEDQQHATAQELLDASAAIDVPRIQLLQNRLSDLDHSHASLLADWEQAAAQLEELEARL